MSFSSQNLRMSLIFEELLSTKGTCLTSGCFMRVSAHKDTAGYDVRMFIDCVDFDICYSLRAAGYKIVRIPYDGLIHEIGI